MEFPDSSEVAFLKLGNDLLLLSSGSKLMIRGYYHSSTGTFSLALKMGGSRGLITPEEFADRAAKPVSFR